MIITCENAKEQLVIERLAKENIPCTAVGEIVDQENGIKLIENGKENDLPYFTEDPYWKAFFKAYKSGLK